MCQAGAVAAKDAEDAKQAEKAALAQKADGMGGALDAAMTDDPEVARFEGEGNTVATQVSATQARQEHEAEERIADARAENEI